MSDEIFVQAKARIERRKNILELLDTKTHDTKLDDLYNQSRERAQNLQSKQNELTSLKKRMIFQESKTRKLQDFLLHLETAQEDINKEYNTMCKIRLPQDDTSIYQEYRARLREIFKQKEPRQLRNIDRILHDWHRQEHQIYGNYCRKYRIKPKAEFFPERKVNILDRLPLGPCRFSVTKDILKIVRANTEADEAEQNKEDTDAIIDLFRSAAPDNDWKGLMAEVLQQCIRARCNVLNCIQAAFKAFDIGEKEMGEYLVSTYYEQPSPIRFAIQEDFIEGYDDVFRFTSELKKTVTKLDPAIYQLLSDDTL